MTRIAIFASGAGSNAQKIIEHFSAALSSAGTMNRTPSAPSVKVEVALIVSNNIHAGVLSIAKKEHIDTLIIEKEQFFRGNAYTDELKERKIDFIVLAGFLWKVPPLLIQAYRNSIVNIHPALLPSYGGKGMYGANVHDAVLKAGEKKTGITIHYVDEHYDNGDIIFQADCLVNEGDTSESLAEKVHRLEHSYYPVIIEKVINLQNRS